MEIDDKCLKYRPDESADIQDNVEIPCLPGHPRVRTSHGIDAFLEDDLCTPELDQLYSWLWLISTPSASSITPLHRQRLRGREIVVMEDPGLHLVWHRHAIYIKPIPRYLLDKAFRERLFGSAEAQPAQNRRIAVAARGYLRTYALLIQHESDFRIAQSDSLQLLPKAMAWDSFNSFMDEIMKESAAFDQGVTTLVSARYRNTGELRFSRLNILVKLVLRRWHYRYTDGRYKDYLENFYAPCLFLFAVVSIVLNAMQVALASEEPGILPWPSLASAARGFAGFTFAITLAMVAVMVLLLGRKLVAEVLFALATVLKRRGATVVHPDRESLA